MEDMLVWVKVAKCFAAALAIGLGTMGPSISQGRIGATSCENIGKYPQSSGDIKQTAFLALVIVETASIFSLLIAFVILLFVS